MNLLIVTGIFPPDIGGPATYVPQIAKGLAERGYVITVVSLSDDLNHDDTEYPFRVVRLPRKAFKPLRWLKTVITLVRLGQKADVLLVNGIAMEAGLANFLLRKPSVQKVVGDLAWERAMNKGWVTEGFEEFQERRHGLRVEFLKMLRIWWTKRADQVIVPSRYLAHWVEGWGVPKEKIVVIYNAVQSVDGLVPAYIPLDVPLKLVTVGRLVPWKRVDRIIEAVASLKGVGLVVIGDGPQRPHLEALAENLGTRNRLYWAGSRKKEDTQALIAGCDIFVLNSTYEGLPHVVLEAMALGLPVVATAVGGTPEVVQQGRNGVLIPPDGGGLTEALKRLCSDGKERRRLAEGAKNTVIEFSFTSMLKATEQVLNEH